MYIYKITNIINGKIYIGQTIQKNKNRWHRHISGNGNVLIKSSLKNKYTKEDFQFSIVEYCDSLNELNKKEKFWIKELNCLHPNGYNLDSGGKNLKKHIKTKEKLSKYPLKYFTKEELTQRLSNTWEKNKRKIKSYNITTKEIKYYDSVNSVSKCVQRVLNGKRKTYNNCLWQYLELEFDFTKINKSKTNKKVYRIDGNLIKEYPSLKSTKKDGFYPDSITRSVNKNGYYKGFLWSFEPPVDPATGLPFKGQ